jgi:hypothetical protein
MTPSAAHARHRGARPRRGTRAASESPTALPAIRWRGRWRTASAPQRWRVPGEVRLHVLGQHHGDAEIIARHEPQLVERARIFLASRTFLRSNVIVEELLNGAKVAKGVARVYDAKLLLRELPPVTRVGVDCAERVAC